MYGAESSAIRPKCVGTAPSLDPGARPGVSVYRNALSFAAIGLGVCLPAPLSLSPLPLPLQIIYLSIH